MSSATIRLLFTMCLVFGVLDVILSGIPFVVYIALLLSVFGVTFTGYFA